MSRRFEHTNHVFVSESICTKPARLQHDRATAQVNTKGMIMTAGFGQAESGGLEQSKPVYAQVWLTPAAARLGLVTAIAAGAGAGFAATGQGEAAHAIAAAGPDLTRLLRGMALIKMLLASLAGAAVFWRLGAAIGPVRFTAYAAAGAAMAAGPGLIWDMSHVAAGAVLLHAGLLATILIFWRDPAVAARLSESIAARQARRLS